MFPEFERFVTENDLVAKATGTGSLSAKLPRILGQGKTKAIGLDLPPAPIERKQEMVSLDLPHGIELPQSVRVEIDRVKKELEEEIRELASPEGARRLCSKVIERLEAPRGIKNNHFYAGCFLLIPDKTRQTWAWSITPYYPIISKIPPDIDYLVKAYEIADKKITELIMNPERFEHRLELAWAMAKLFSKGNDVLIVDVARMFLIAAQDDRFWQSPQKKNFKDLPQAAFVSNFLNWKQTHGADKDFIFELVPAVLSQTRDLPVFYLPLDHEGTQTRPYIYMKLRKKEA